MTITITLDELKELLIKQQKLTIENTKKRILSCFDSCAFLDYERFEEEVDRWLNHEQYHNELISINKTKK